MTDIKLVATDMDGTLLTNKGELPPHFFALFERLKAKGIHFVAASGRQYFNLAKKLDIIKNEVIFVAENGSYVVFQDQELYVQSLDKNTTDALIKVARQIPNAFAIYCGKKKAYVESAAPELWAQFTKYFERYELVEDLLEITDDECLKVSICDLGGSATNSYPHFKPWSEPLQVKVSAGIWLDISHKEANKGKALEVLQQRYGITIAQTMAFGDYLNDLEMMAQAHYSYAMENAHPDIKAAARFQAKSNEEFGVVEVLSKMLAQS